MAAVLFAPGCRGLVGAPPTRRPREVQHATCPRLAPCGSAGCGGGAVIRLGVPSLGSDLSKLLDYERQTPVGGHILCSARPMYHRGRGCLPHWRGSRGDGGGSRCGGWSRGEYLS